MTTWLQKRLAIWMGGAILGGALLWNGGALRAQDYFDESQEEPRPKLTRDEAAKNFVALMRGDLPFSRTPNWTTVVSSKDGNITSFSRSPKFASGISQKSLRDLGKDAGDRPEMLFQEMMLQWRRPNQTVRVQSEGDKTATVIVEEDPTQPTRPLVLIEEDGGWGVDLIETYAGWNNLRGAAKAEAIYKLTGVVLEDLPPSEERTRKACQSNLRQIALGIAMYVQDYDEKYPLAKPWSDVLQPYLKSERLFNCPSLPKIKRYGYAYNSKLSNKYISIFSNTAKTVSVYETSILKPNAYGTGESLAFRHQGGANYAFADGHVKWFPKTEIPSFKLKP